MTWQCEDLAQEAANEDRFLLQAYMAHGLARPLGPIADVAEEDWARIRPDNLAPFWCACGGLFHVRRHFDAHRCESRAA